jgi:N-acetylmuramoyl-L-alanine amidase
MGLHKSDANLAVAKAENAAILLEDDYVEKYDGFDPNSPEGNIFFSMMQNSFLDRSLGFAGNVQHELADNLKKFNRGVKQAGFLVLYKTAMPSVLIETGFICNANDEKFLLSAKGQDQTAEAIFKALRNYKSQVEKKIPFNTNNDTLIRREIILDKDDFTDEKNPEPTKTISQKTNHQSVSYRVQFATFPESIPTDSPRFNGLEKVKMYIHSGAFKYTSGDCADFESALVLRKSLIAKGYKDAFVVAFKGNERITNEEARRLTGKK